MISSTPILFLKSVIIFLILLNHGQCFLIETKQGKVRGKTEISRGGRHFYAFYGIPYAEPPIGELRFENPVPAKNWEGIRDATNLPPVCLNKRLTAVLGQEDCLYLNVYTPKIEKKSFLPVLVYVYGGYYMYGHALPDRYGPHYFMDKDVIVITFHYRLGPLGYLNTGDEVMPGNYGLKDFVEVLRWTQRNIESYGGDKNKVTIGGGSSGGAMASLAIISPSTKGLFHRCIAQSGMPQDVPKPDFYRRMAYKFTSFTSCGNANISSSEQLKSCLKKLPVAEISDNFENLYTFSNLLPPSVYGPVIENEKVPEAFLIDQPSKLFEGNLNIPMLLGVNSGEGGMLAIYLYLAQKTQGSTYNFAKDLEENYLKYFPEFFGYAKENEDFETLKEKTEAIVKYYFGKTRISENPLAFAQIFTDLLSVKLKETVKMYQGVKYVYYYDHRNKESFDKYYGSSTDTDFGVLHGDEVISFFNWSEAIKPVTEGIDLTVSEQVLELWTNFVTFGDPNGNNVRKIWEPAETTNFRYLHIKNGKLEMKTELNEPASEFWKSLAI